MILKGNIRAGGQELARHLMNMQDNDRVEIADMEGFAAQDLAGAFAETEAIATGTNCKKYLYSLSINPSKELTRDQYAHAILKIEKSLGLEGQARAVVFHQKHGREHCHVAWSRIDLEKMQARHNAFDRQKLREVARELCHDFGHDMPKHLAEDRGKDRHKDKFNAASLAEQGQAKRSGIDPKDRREIITEAYRQSDTAGAFRAALSEQGYVLAKGDKRGFVVVDRAGEVHSLTRQIEGVKAKEIEGKLRLKDRDDLPSVTQAKDLHAIEARQKAAEATQERPDTPDRVEIAQDALSALRDAQKAELKSLKAAHAERLAALREEKAARDDEIKRQIKEAYRPEWAALFKRQRAEQRAVEQSTDTTLKRLKAVLSGERPSGYEIESMGKLSGLFNFVVRGQLSTAKMEKAHRDEKKQVSDMQRLAEREERAAIRDEIADRRRDAQDEYKHTIATVKSYHADELGKAIENLERAREITERGGDQDINRSAFEKAADPKPAKGFGFAKQGFDRQGMGFGFRDQEDERTREDEEEGREISPPGRGFDPS